uniref:DsDNA helicase n=1 Tax=Myoviridae sp. ct89I2 TaxID=2827662 RepID=A0A8S5TC48_9CAUD|nr:MAG TPA: dsDNA helicase [Myoviridae sp. ct89I2]
MKEYSEKEFSELLPSLDIQSVVDAETFGIVMAEDEPYIRTRKEIMLRKRAKELGLSVKVFDKLFKSFADGYAAKLKSAGGSGKKDVPLWYSPETKKIDEIMFVTDFNFFHGYACINGQLYGSSGKVSDAEVLAQIQNQLSYWVTMNLAKRSNDLLRVLKNQTYKEPAFPDQDKIPVQNGYVRLDGSLCPEFEFSPYRFPVVYAPEAGEPSKWNAFLSDLLNPTDILTLQEFLGYALIPTNRAQKSLYIIGSGGEGKSVIGTIAQDIFGNCMVSGSLHDLDENRFAVASLENALLFLDDELSTNACRESRRQKEIVTADKPIRVERKGVQSYDANVFCKLMAFGNVPFDTLYDHSDGAFRRRIILRTKAKPEGRKDDRNLSETLKNERESIFLWCFKGLQRLIANGWEFTISEEAQEEARQSKEDSFNFIGFLNDEGSIKLGDKKYSASSTHIYAAYFGWCRDNAEDPFKRKTVIKYLKDNAKRLGVEYSFNVPTKQGSHVRGFNGVEIKRFVPVDDLEGFGN